MQPRSKRSEQPAPQARASVPLHASREWASGRFRALRDRTQGKPALSAVYRSAPSRPLGGPDRTGVSGCITLRQNFRVLNLLLGRIAGRHWTLPAVTG